MTIEFYKEIYHKTKNNSLVGIFSGSLNDKFIFVMAKKIFGPKFDINKNISVKELEKFYFAIKSFKLKVLRTKTFDDAQVTIGGISCDEINEETFESKIVSGIYFMGEIMDFTGSCGGYNIHFCAVGGKVVAEEVCKKFKVK
jgi:predicted flavoprotein YhiN